MIARAAEQPELWPHLLAIAWQALWVALILRVARAPVPPQRAQVRAGARRWWRFAPTA